MKHLWKYQHKVLFFLVLLCMPLSAFGATKSDECLGCHDKFKQYVHGGLGCEDCHADATSLPHREKLDKPTCDVCHQALAKAHARSIHSAVECKACHSVHAAGKGSKTCNDCHATADHR